MSPVKIPRPPSVGEATLKRDLRAMRTGRGWTTEYRFSERRGWRFDFAWPQVRLAVEVEGGTRGRSRHTKHEGFSEDIEKYNAATIAGWRVLRFTTEMITSGRAIEVIEQALEAITGSANLLGDE